MVSSLIDPRTKWWKVNTIRATFLPFEVETILKIPLSHDLPEDKIIWIENRRGDFTVKSAYHLAYNLLASNDRGECSAGDPCKPIWRKLWHLNLPPKIKIFAWRACINGLPTMEAINQRGISHSRTCPVCNNEAESLDHALLGCAFASSVWNLWLENPLNTHGTKNSFLDSTVLLLSHSTPQNLELFFTAAWAIWYNRNKIVHNGGGLSPNQVWLMANSNINDFRGSALWDFSLPKDPPTCWAPPPQGFFKINVDGASSDLENSSSVGVVIRDNFGQVVAALSKPLQACFPADLSEILALENGILLAQELHLSRVIIESDSLEAIQAVLDKATGSSFGHIVQSIIQIIDSFETCLFKHLSRNFNAVAHELAQLARRTGSHHLWIGVSPPCVASLVRTDLL